MQVDVVSRRELTAMVSAVGTGSAALTYDFERKYPEVCALN